MSEFIWDLPDDLDGNYHHIREHDVTREEVEEVLSDRGNAVARSASTGRPIAFGWTSTGKYIAVVFELVDEDPRVIYPITAFPAPEPRRKKRKQ